MEFILQFSRSYRKIEVYRHLVNSSYYYQLPAGRILNYLVDAEGIFIECAIPPHELPVPKTNILCGAVSLAPSEVGDDILERNKPMR